MKKLLLISLILFPAITFAARFDWSKGTSEILEDGVISDTLEESREDWSGGKPTITFDTTAVDTTPVAGGTATSSVEINSDVTIMGDLSI